MGLTHSDVLVNADALCEIDIHTRKITRKSKKSEFQQYDHNSERIGFTMERMNDGHDMSQCDRVAIKYLNVRQDDMYIVDDVSVSDDGKHVIFTWLVSANATQEVGSLAFLVNFRCWNDEGEITYNWSTHPCSTYSILKGVPSMDSNPKEQYDFWAKYKGLVDGVIEDTENVGAKLGVLSEDAKGLTDITEALKPVVNGLSTNVPVLENKVNSLNSKVPTLESKVKTLENTLSNNQAQVLGQEIADINATIDGMTTSKVGEGDSTFFKDTYNILDNKIDTTNVGYQLNNQTGELYAASGCSVTDYIPVKENTLYHAFGISIYNYYSDFANRCVFYDADKKYLSYVEDVTQRYFTTPVGCRYIRFSQGVSTGVDMHNLYIGTKEADLRLYIKDNYEFEYSAKSGFDRVSYNLFDKSKITEGYRNSLSIPYGYYYTDEEALNATDGYFVSDYIPVNDGDVLHIGYYSNGVFHHVTSTQRVFTAYDAKKRILYRREGTGLPYEVGEQVAYIRFYDSLTYVHAYMVVKNEVPTKYVPYAEKPMSDEDELVRKGEHRLVNHWMGKNCVTYGDSITAQGNADGFGYQHFMKREIEFANMYNRGVGGQTYVWNNSTFYANTDGSYNSRDELHSPPEGTTEHNGSFCSWDRITTMIPRDVRETIDLIVVMGGTNDHGQNKIDSEEISWSSANTVDTDWKNDTEFYNGGDYDITSFTGAMASTIMKMQIWCPNAVIVVATPFCKWDTSTNRQWVNAVGMTLDEVADIEIKVANHMSVPVIDVNATCCINAFNYNTYVRDGVHPSTAGEKRLARAVISGLTTIYPMINDD